MSWTPQDQELAVAEMVAYITETNLAFETHINALRSGQNPLAAQAALEDVLRRWRLSIDRLRAKSETLTQSEGLLDSLNQLIATVQEESSLLSKLQSEAVTRTDQATSVNPKVVPSPYTNILGLQRTFRQSTRNNILIATIVFAVLAIGIAGYAGFRAFTAGSPPSYPGRGGARAVSSSSNR